jgi:uncharacterized membrane protein
MNRLVLLGISALAVAGVVHGASVVAVPRVIMQLAMSRIAGAEGTNVMKDAALSTASAETVVRPSPDLAYSACVLDLTRGAVRLIVHKSAPYTSLSLFSAQTDNYFVEDDRYRNGAIELIVVGPGASVPPRLPEGARVVEAPSAHGIAIVRRVVEERTALLHIEAARKLSFCVPYPG